MTEQTAPARQGHAARSAALKRLLEAHAEEFATILAEERKARGLFPAGKRVTLKSLSQELEEAKAALAAAQAELAAANPERA